MTPIEAIAAWLALVLAGTYVWSWWPAWRSRRHGVIRLDQLPPRADHDPRLPFTVSPRPYNWQDEH